LALPVALTFLGHAHFEALLQPAVLAAIPGHLVDDAVLVSVTCIYHVLLDATAEEALGRERGSQVIHTHRRRSAWPKVSAWGKSTRPEKVGR
jgi:hypothetical protein